MNNGVYILSFDMPQKTSKDKKIYSKFIKSLKKEGYFRIQKSIYFKQSSNIKLKKYEEKRIKNISPENSNVFIIVLTNKQYDDIIQISGNKILLDNRTVIII